LQGSAQQGSTNAPSAAAALGRSELVKHRHVIVELSPGSSLAWASVLGEAGHSFYTCTSSAAVLAVVETFGYKLDAVFFDSSVDEADVLTIVGAIRRLALGHRIALIRIAANPSEAQIIAGLRAGVWHYVATPCSPELLLALIESIASDHERHQRLLTQFEQDNQALRNLTEGVFRFRSIEDVEQIARLIANACAHPDRVILGLSELMLNAIEHGNLGIGFEEKLRINARGTWLEEINRRLAAPEQTDRYATLVFRREPGAFTIRIEDTGKGFDWTPYFEISTKRAFDPHGRGIAVARSLSFDSLVYFGRGNIVTATVREKG